MSVSKRCIIILLVTEMIQVRFFTILLFGFIVLFRDCSSSGTCISLMFMNFSE